MQRRPELPWRRRQQVRATKTTWWAKVWASRTVWGVVGAAVVWGLANGVESLSNLRKLPSEVQSTYHAFQSWYYDDAEWTGTWSSREEGYVEDFFQADLPLKLTVRTVQGEVTGEMFNLNVCNLNPTLPPIFVQGKIKGGVLIAVAYAYQGGRKRVLYAFKAVPSKGEPVITLSPLLHSENFIPEAARLVSRVDASVEEFGENEALTCPESSIEFIMRMLKQDELDAEKEEP